MRKLSPGLRSPLPRRLKDGEVEELLRRLLNGKLSPQESIDVQETVIRHNKPFIIRMAGRYAKSAEEKRFCVEAGLAGLREALFRFDPERGTKFLTYAAWWARKEIIRSIRFLRQGGGPHITPYAFTVHLNVKRAIAKILKENPSRRLSEISDEEIAERIGRDPRTVKAFRESLPENVSLEDCVKTRRRGKIGTTFGGMLPQDIFTDPLEAMVHDENREIVRRALERLPPTGKYVIERRFGLVDDLEEGESLKEVGISLEISREAVRQIEAKALAKLKFLLRNSAWNGRYRIRK